MRTVGKKISHEARGVMEGGMSFVEVSKMIILNVLEVKEGIFGMVAKIDMCSNPNSIEGKGKNMVKAFDFIEEVEIC